MMYIVAHIHSQLRMNAQAHKHTHMLVAVCVELAELC